MPFSHKASLPSQSKTKPFFLTKIESCDWKMILIRTKDAPHHCPHPHVTCLLHNVERKPKIDETVRPSEERKPKIDETGEERNQKIDEVEEKVCRCKRASFRPSS